MTKLFNVTDRSGRGFGTSKMNQTRLIKFVGSSWKEEISDIRVGQVYYDIPAVRIKRLK